MFRSVHAQEAEKEEEEAVADARKVTVVAMRE